MKRRFLDSIILTVEPGAWILIVFAIILLPLPWVLGWFFAVAMHELGHIVGIALFRIPVLAVHMKFSGIYVQTEQMLPFQEFVIAAMGPIFGIIPIAFSQWLPYTVTCAMVQFVFNMLPIMGFDGGRILSGILGCFLSSVNVHRCMRAIHRMIFLACIVAVILFRWNILAILFGVVLLLRLIPVTFPCKRGKQIVQ